jgi:amidophosphoribosyltransferase
MNKHCEDAPKEGCGLFGIYNAENAAEVIFAGLFALQHRGQEGAGIVVSDGQRVRSHKGVGLVGQVFTSSALNELRGRLGVGHVRYSTTGLSKPYNVQPLVVECMDGIWAIAHNGNLTNARELRLRYQQSGAIFQTSTDSEILLHLLADPEYRDRPRRVERALSELQGAYSFLLMTKDQLMAARDPFGFRPLVIGQIEGGYVFASETCALEQVGAEYVRDVLPGELVTADAKGIRSTMFFPNTTQSLGQCIFEHIYFARPDSLVFGQSVQEVRHRLGCRLAKESPADADIVVPIPDSGSEAALGYSQTSGIPLSHGFIRNHYVGRTFIMPDVAQRAKGVDFKLAVSPTSVADKRVVVVDDSLVRGTTCRRRVKALREAGAREVHLRISCPPIRHPCFFGIDFPSPSELIASGHSVEEICRFVEAHSLAYLSMEGLLSAVDAPGHYCKGCFTGHYPVQAPLAHSKKILETHHGNESSWNP